MVKKDKEQKEEEDELFRLDRLLGEVEEIEQDQFGGKKKNKVKEEDDADDLPEPIKLEPLEVVEEKVESTVSPVTEGEETKEAETEAGVEQPPKEAVILDENGQPCDQCTIAAKKFIEDKFCSLVDDDEKKDKCIVEAMKIVVQVKSGKISMHEFEKKVKEIGQKYITDWEPDEDVGQEIIPPETKEELRRDD